jgi:hypothetical protein
MSNTNTGGPAFPAKDEERAFPSTFKSLSGQEQRHIYGMTLRDYFAAKAMASVIARGDDTNRPGMAEWSYAMADAMLKARQA